MSNPYGPPPGAPGAPGGPGGYPGGQFGQPGQPGQPGGPHGGQFGGPPSPTPGAMPGMMPPAAAPMQPGTGRLVVDCSYPAMSFMLAATGPSVLVNGQQYGHQWGQTVVDLPPGQYQLHAHTRYMGQMGKADTTVPVTPGQQVKLYYRAPMTIFNRGALGPTPQSSPGKGVLIGIIVVPLALVFLFVVIAIIASL